MREMKDSGVEWIGEIPKEWKTRKIKNVATLAGRIGWQGLTSNEYCEEGAYLITGINFKNGIIEWDKCFHIPISRWEEATQIQIQEGDLLITKDGTVGKVAIAKDIPGKTSLNSGVLLIRNNNECHTKFLFWLLNSEVFWKWFIIINAGNSTIIHLYQHSFENFSFPFPKLNEQKRVVDYLDKKCSKIDEIIEKQQAIIEKLKEYKLSVITEAVTKGLNPDVEMKDSGIEWIGKIPKKWKMVKLNSICDDIRNGYVGPTRNILVDDGVPYIQSLNVKDGTISFEKGKYFVSEEWGKQHPKVYEGQIVIVQTGDIGQVGLVKKNMNGYNCHALIIVSLNTQYVFPSYVQYYFRSKPGKELLLETSTGALLPHLNSGRIKSTSIVSPNVIEQKNIAHYLDGFCEKIDNAVDKKEIIIERLKEYKKSLIYEVVTGKKEI